MNNTLGGNNAFTGNQSGLSNTDGNNNTFMGTQSGRNTTTGDNNTFFGSLSGRENITGNNNTVLGASSGPAVGSGALANATAVGANVSLTQSNTVVLGNNANVGIGTNTPTQKLDVTGNAVVSGRIGVGNTAPTQALDVNGGILARWHNPISNQGAYLQWNRSGNEGETWLLNQRGNGSPNSGIRFGTVTTANVATEWGRFHDNGNFGLGSTAPTQKLDVTGNAVVSGNVGIGTSTPSQKLDVRGNIRLGDNTGGTGVGSGIELVGPGTNTDIIGLYRANVASNVTELRMVVGDDPASLLPDKFVLGTTSAFNGPDQLLTGTFTPRFTVTGNGDTGIGTDATVPTATLDVAGSTRLRGLTTAGVVTTDADGNLSSTAAQPADNLGNHTATQNLDLAANQLVGNGGASGLNISNDGNVGIGAPTPNSRLSLTPTAVEPKITLWDNGSTTDHYGFGISTNQLNYHVAGAADRHVFYSGGKNGDGTELMRIQGNGNVGIRTATPATTLDVRTTDASAAITVGQTNNTAGALYFGNTAHGVKRNYASGNDVGLYTTAANLYLSTNGTSTSQFVLNNSGNVGIGTAPGARLHVAGTMKIDGANTLEFGAGVTKEVNAGKIGYQAFSTALDIVGAGTTSGNRTIRFWAEGGAIFTGSVTGVGAFNTSDARFKQNVRPLGGALVSVLALRGVRYEWNALGQQHGGKAGQGQVGVIAQEIEQIYPELVTTDADGYKAVNYAQLTPVLIEALKEQQAQIEALKVRAAQADTDHASLLTLQAQMARLLGEAALTGGQARK